MAPKTDPGDRRRKSPRAGVVLRLQYRNAGHLLVSYCTNLSRGGLFVPSPDPLPAGSKLTLSLAIPGEKESAEIDAEVRWVRQFDAAEGPAGMGLAFDDVDDILGERIDGVVSEFTPLQVALVGDRPHVMRHVAGRVRSLVSCQTVVHEVRRDVLDDVQDVDLVIIDVDSAPGDTLILLRQLANRANPPPRVALCNARDAELRNKVVPLARIVATPVDAEDLRATVLETVTQVEASREDRG